MTDTWVPVFHRLYAIRTVPDVLEEASPSTLEEFNALISRLRRRMENAPGAEQVFGLKPAGEGDMWNGVLTAHDAFPPGDDYIWYFGATPQAAQEAYRDALMEHIQELRAEREALATTPDRMRP